MGPPSPTWHPRSRPGLPQRAQDEGAAPRSQARWAANPVPGLPEEVTLPEASVLITNRANDTTRLLQEVRKVATGWNLASSVYPESYLRGLASCLPCPALPRDDRKRPQAGRTCPQPTKPAQETTLGSQGGPLTFPVSARTPAS
jgi:hypothetical protein